MKIPVINLILEGASMEQAQQYQKLIHTLFTQGAFSVRNGRVILHFDSNGTLQQIDIDAVRWKSNKEPLPSLSVPKTRVEISA